MSWKKQIGIAKKQSEITKEKYRGLEKIYGFSKTVVNKNYENSYLVFDNFDLK